MMGRRRFPRVIGSILMSLLVAACGFSSAGCAREPSGAEDEAIRCAVIGGMTETGLWNAVSERFTKETGIKVALVLSGPKHVITGPFRKGDVDLITMHASDAIINLVADGHGVDPQPWARNDFLLVGPPADPAKIRGMSDAVAALGRIIETKSRILVHQSQGTNEVLHDLLAEGELGLDPESTISLPIDRHRQLLQRAAREKAYTLVGRIPFLNGKIVNEGLEIMVQGDARLRRPYVVVTRAAPPEDRRAQAARQLARFLRSPDTQKFIAEFGRGVFDKHPLFFPVAVEPAATR